jgi:hypothetical protein
LCLVALRGFEPLTLACHIRTCGPITADYG